MLFKGNDVGNRVIGKAVAATMYNGAVVLLEADSGCAALDFEGPHVPQNRGFESIVFSDVGNPSNPDMVADEATDRRIQMSRCGGLVRTEEWTVTFDEVLGNWEVEGSMSGIQGQRAIDGERWVSDNGGFSFTMVAGSQPASEGDRFTFFTDEGILRIDAIERGDGQIMPLELPGEPTVFQYLQARPMTAGMPSTSAPSSWCRSPTRTWCFGSESRLGVSKPSGTEQTQTRALARSIPSSSSLRLPFLAYVA